MDVVLRMLVEVSAVEWLGVALALAYLILAIRQSPWCWLFAAVSSLVYLWVFARAALTMQAALQVFYVLMAAYGWFSWRRGPDASAASHPVVRWPPSRHAIALAAIVAVVSVNMLLTGNGQDAADGGATTGRSTVAVVDSFVAWASVFTTWLVARKVLENWLYWIVIDVVAAGLYWSQGLHATSLLFVVYTVIAGRGYVAWRRSMGHAESPTAAANV